MSSINGTSNTLVDQYVEAYVATQQYRFEPLDMKSAQLEDKQLFFNNLNTRLNSLLTAMDKFGTYKNVTDSSGNTSMQFEKVKDIDSKFVTRKIATSSPDFVSASAKGSAMVGTNSVKVLQLATADTFIGKQVSLGNKEVVNEDGTKSTVGTLSDDLKAKLDAEGNGKLEFSININGTDKAFSIDYSENDTTEDVMKRIVQTVNQRKIENADGENEGGLGDVMNAAFVKDTSGTARLTFTSKSTGEENQIKFTGADETVQNLFGIPADDAARTEYSDGDSNSFGYQKAAISDLNAKVNLNGVTITRGSNTISDAIDGVTLTLKKVNSESDVPTTLSTEIDTKAVEDLINPLMESFNNVANFIAVNKDLHGNDASMTSLQNALRSLTSEDISGYAEEGYQYSDSETKPIRFLAELGFKMSNENVLTLADPSKLENMLKTADGPKLIADAINGFAARVSEYVENLSSREDRQGLIKSRLSSINQQIEANNKRIQQVDDSILKSAEATRKQYTSYLEAFYSAQNQSLLMNLMPSGGGAYDSLLQQKYSQEQAQ